MNALTLLARGRHQAAFQATDRLADLQNNEGNMGLQPQTAGPGWPTSLAALAWLAATNARCEYGGFAVKAIAWIRAELGQTSPRLPVIGHNTMLAGSSWAHDTHSWTEPSTLRPLAMKAASHEQHAYEGIRLLLDLHPMVCPDRARHTR